MARSARILIRPWAVAALLVFSGLFALKLGEPMVLHFLPASASYVRRLLIVIIQYATAAAVVLMTARMAPRTLPLRAVVLTAALLVGVAMGYLLAIGLDEVTRLWLSDPIQVVTAPAGFLLMGLLGVALLLMDERDRDARRLLHERQLRLIELARSADEARLAVLRSQVEPHFLFNTLAHLQHLYASNPSAGRAMMRDLIGYLEDAQPALHLDSVPLRKDAELARTYLKLQQVRMGDRLAFSFEVSDAAAAAQVPPLTLTTLVENAIKHGLAPKLDGGRVWIRATADAARARIEVTDDGVGLQPSFGSGVGLSNLRARLELLHGASSRLELSQQHPGGVTATVIVPVGTGTQAC